MNALRVPRQRAIIDRRALASEIDALVGEHGDKARPHVVKLLKTALDKGRAELERRLEEKPSAGHENAGGFAFMIDQLIRVIHDHATAHLYPSANRSKAERLAIMAVGGYGRSEMSPHSDVDIAFLVGGKSVPQHSFLGCLAMRWPAMAGSVNRAPTMATATSSMGAGEGGGA